MSSLPSNNFNQQLITAGNYYGSQRYWDRNENVNELERKYSKPERRKIYNDSDSPNNPSSLKNPINKCLRLELLLGLGRERAASQKESREWNIWNFKRG